MVLNMVKDIECPVCGCKDIDEEIMNHQHCNGYWNEYRTFHCGLTLHFTPNYMKIYREGECNNDPVVIECNKLQNELKNELIKQIQESKIDNRFKEKLIEQIKWCRS